MTRSAGLLRRLRARLAPLAAAGALAGCAALDYGAGLSGVELDEGLVNQLASGELLQARMDLEARPFDALTPDERTVLCDLLVRHVAFDEAEACLDRRAELDAVAPEVTDGKRALLALISGRPARAERLTRGAVEAGYDGGAYLHALSRLAQDDPAPARRLARLWAGADRPETAALAAALEMALSREEPAALDRLLEILEDPERRLAADYAVTPARGLGGASLAPVPLRVDLLRELGFGVFGAWSLAPRANAEIEYMLAHAKAFAPGPRRDPEAAMARLDRLLDGGPESELAASRDLHWRALADRAALWEAQGDRAGARRDLQAAIDVIESARASADTDAAKIGFAGDRLGPYRALARLALDEGDAEAAFAAAEAGRGRALIDLLQTVERFGPGGGAGLRSAGEVERTLDELALAERADVEAKAAQLYPRAEDYENPLRAMTPEYRRRLAGEMSPQLLSLTEGVRTPPETLRRSLEPGQALISYFHLGGDDGWQVFAVTPEGGVAGARLELPAEPDGLASCFAATGRRDPLSAAADAFVRAIRPESAGPDGAEACAGLDRWLGRAVLEPALDLIGDADVHALLIAPWGDLRRIPFAALRIPGPGRAPVHAVDRFTLVHLATPALLEHVRPEWRRRGRMLAVGYDGEREIALETGDGAFVLPPLPNVEAEIAGISVRYGRGSDALVGTAQATRDRVRARAEARQYDVIHIAGHAWFDPEDPNASFIQLSPGPGASDIADGRLTVRDMFAVENRWDARLLVLSACETGRGVSRGDEVLAFHRGAAYAGADALVTSLWKVRDEATRRFMTFFYEHLGRSGADDPASSLRHAQCRLRALAPDRPGDWAAFTYSGPGVRPPARGLCPPLPG